MLCAGSEVALGKGTWLGYDVLVEPLAFCGVRLGENSSVQDRCRLIGDILIGDDVLLAPNVFISSGAHFYNHNPPLPIRIQDRIVAGDEHYKALRSQKVVIENDCWIGTNTVIMRGVTVGKGAIIGANSVVTKDVPPYTIQAGTPARMLRNRLDFQPPAIIKAGLEAHLPYFYAGLRVIFPNSRDILLFAKGAFVLCLEPSGEGETLGRRTVTIAMNAVRFRAGLQVCHGGVSRDVVSGRKQYEFIAHADMNKYHFEFMLEGKSINPGELNAGIYLEEAELK
jgi:acetyltransferase-like isoleucine patch superfamily enzyme